MKAKNNDTSSLIASFILLAILFLVWWGMENTEVALFLIEHPVMILPYVLEKLVNRFGYLKLISGSFIAALITVFLLKPNNKLHRHNRSVVRGAKVIPTRQLKALLKKEPKSKYKPQ
jgi:uncharacterized membrane protein YgaE (UPF0421/DUF939 family)